MKNIYINQNNNTLLYEQQQKEKQLNLWKIIPMQTMLTIWKEENLMPHEQCKIVIETAPEWVKLVLNNDYSVFDVVHDFTNLAKQEPFFVPRITEPLPFQ